MARVIEAVDLTKRYGSATAVDSVSFGVDEGEIYGYLGLNGAGKTTTVRMLTGTLPPTSGHARVHGTNPLHDSRKTRARIGVLFDKNIVPEPEWSPIRYLRYFGTFYGMDALAVARRARALFRELDLMPFAETPIRALSGGNKRKVELSRALLHEPDIIFLDEPTRELDIPSKKATWNHLRRLAKGGTTIFLSSHDVQEISNLCTRIGIIAHGRLRWEGPTRDLAEAEGGLMEALSARLKGHTPGGATYRVVNRSS